MNSVAPLLCFVCVNYAMATLPTLTLSSALSGSSSIDTGDSSGASSPSPSTGPSTPKEPKVHKRYTLQQVAKTIDHALLKPEMAKEVRSTYTYICIMKVWCISLK